MSVKAIYIVTVSLMKKPDGGTSWKVTPQKFSILATGGKDAEQCARKVVEQDEWIIQKGIQIREVTVRRFPMNGMLVTDKYRSKNNI